MTEEWKRVAVRFDGTVYSSDAPYKESEMPSGRRLKTSWVKIIDLPSLIVEEWTGYQDPGYSRLLIYVPHD